MMKLARQMFLLTASLLVAAGTTMAQLPTAPGAVAGYREVKDERLVVQPFNLTVDQIDDMTVHSMGGEKIGEIDEVLMDASGQPIAVSVEVGRFLGAPDREVIVGFDQLRLDRDRFVTSLTRAQIEALPHWHD